MTDRRDIEWLFKTNYESMWRIATSLLHEDDLARDIVHDVFASSLDRQYDMGEKANAYLLMAVKNRCLNHIRDCGIHQRIEKMYFIENAEYDSDDWPDDDTLARIRQLIRCDLSPQARKIIELRFSESLPFKQIASTLDISETAVYRHLSNALKTLRSKLNKHE